MEFPDRDAVKQWIIDNQIGRRNLNLYDRTNLEDQKRHILAEQAKKNIGGDRKSAEYRENHRHEILPMIGKTEDRSGRTDYKIAKAAGTSEDTVRKVRAIRDSGDQKLIDDVRSGETTINGAYQQIHPKKTNPASLRLFYDSCVVHFAA